ncbi:histidinol dehydrogenase [Fulvivirga lutea]|uniref:Histidinol dehydrogenase n=1 Tax=Fulvivirga lutea TaxID=2810512 RepID=A0A974WEX7_9BACT|nr:histidinol dehydrogenase [Fulvivirga lutea]QSE96188.1 histidinol dehydrogenase [Fulvivirga lutea]
MEVIKYTSIEDLESALKRPELNTEYLTGTVKNILQRVKTSGDAALFELTEQFDKTKLDQLQVDAKEIEVAANEVSQELKSAILQAKLNIEKFHAAQKREPLTVETMPGVKCMRKSVPIEKVGLYIPGGTAPLFSTVLMLGIPAQLAGCKKVVLCTPPDKNGKINPAILYSASIVGISQIYKVGGSQAIAALAYGTESILKVNKIFGPGNQYVTKAKQLVNMEGTSIDMPAGPSEVAVIADKNADPAFVAADLLSQAEHGEDSQVLLLSDSDQLIDSVLKEIEEQLKELPRVEVAKRCLSLSKAICTKSLDKCIEISNNYAPEHLIINCEDAEKIAEKITQAGSVFIGAYTPESAGDYASGTNHTLPTNGAAEAYSGVSLDSFMKEITFQQITKEGIKNLGPVVETMAEAEGLMAHKNAVSIRLNELKR